MHYKDFTNKCNRSLHSEYNTMQTNAIVEDRAATAFFIWPQYIIRKWNGEPILEQIVYSGIANL